MWLWLCGCVVAVAVGNREIVPWSVERGGMAIMEDIWETVARMEPKSVAKACSKASSFAATHDIQTNQRQLSFVFDFRRFAVSPSRMSLAWENYLIEAKIGVGAFSTVYRAKHKATEKLVAIKAIKVRSYSTSCVCGGGAMSTKILNSFYFCSVQTVNQPPSSPLPLSSPLPPLPTPPTLIRLTQAWCSVLGCQRSSRTT